MFLGISIDPADLEALLFRFEHGAYPTIWIILPFLIGAIATRFRKKPRVLAVCVISCVLMYGLLLQFIVREVLVNELSSEDDLMAEKAYLTLERWYSSKWALEAITNKSESDNGKFYAAVRLGRAKKNESNSKSDSNIFAPYKNLYVRAGFFSTDRLNAQLRNVCIFREISVAEIMEYSSQKTGW